MSKIIDELLEELRESIPNTTTQEYLEQSKYLKMLMDEHFNNELKRLGME